MALVAFALADKKQDETMVKIFKIMETIGQINWKLIDHEKLANKHVKVNGKDVKVAEFIKILERTSNINWRVIGSLFEQQKISLNKEATVMGQRINLPMMLKVLESVCETDWAHFDSSTGKDNLYRLFLILKFEIIFENNCSFFSFYFSSCYQEIECEC